MFVIGNDYCVQTLFNRKSVKHNKELLMQQIQLADYGHETCYL